MAQGWQVDGVANTITFNEAVSSSSTVVVKEYATGAQNDTDLWAFGAWSEEYGYPAENEYFAERHIFSATTTQPQANWFSKIGQYNNFGRSSPIQDDDAIAATLNARQVNAIRDLVPLDKLLVLTSGGEWKTTGGQDDVLTPSTLAFQPQSYHGADSLPALVIGGTALFLQARGRIVRDIGYSFDVDSYTGNDLTVFSSHLFDGRSIIAWDYQQSSSIVWAVRDDGVLLALAYMREQEVIAWTPMEMDGTVESVCVVSESDEDAVYFVVARTVDGASRRYIERLTNRQIEDVRDSFFVDCGLTFDGRVADEEVMYLATGAGWTTDDSLNLAYGDPIFKSTDVGDWVVFGYGTDDELRLEVTAYVNTTNVTVVPLRDVPAAYRATNITTWAWARDTVGGLYHLEGETVAILSDGNVEDQRVVSSGTVTLDVPGVVVHVGLPYTADFETLDISSPGDTVRVKPKIAKKVNLIVKDSRGIMAGPDFDNLDTWEPRDYDDSYAGAALYSGLAEIRCADTWNDGGRVVVRQSDPLPITILAVIPEFVAAA